jgi:hypothetical protein
MGSAASTASLSGEIVAIDVQARTIAIKLTPTATTSTTVAYRDDSKFQGTVGVGVRFDDYADANAGRLPVALREKVQITWRMSPDGKTRILATIKKLP